MDSLNRKSWTICLSGPVYNVWSNSFTKFSSTRQMSVHYRTIGCSIISVLIYWCFFIWFVFLLDFFSARLSGSRSLRTGCRLTTGDSPHSFNYAHRDLYLLNHSNSSELVLISHRSSLSLSPQLWHDSGNFEKWASCDTLCIFLPGPKNSKKSDF